VELRRDVIIQLFSASSVLPVRETANPAPTRDRTSKRELGLIVTTRRLYQRPGNAGGHPDFTSRIDPTLLAGKRQS